MKRKNRKLKKFLTSPLFVLVVFLSIIGLISYFDNKKKKSIISNASVTIGKVLSFPQGGKSGSMGIVYEYYIYERPLIPLSQSFVHKEFKKQSVKQLFIGKYFPVVYDSTNPKNSHILIDPDDFREYGVPFPDSLNWVLPYFR